MTKNATLLTAMAAALAAAFPAHSQEDEDLAPLVRPASIVEVGVGYVSDDNLRFGQYTGLHEEGMYPLLGVDIVRRYDRTGTWARVRGRNLGLDHRDIRLEHERQGDWRYFIDFSQTPRYSPYIVNTTLGGIDGGAQNEVGEARRDVRLSTRRDALSVGVGKHLGRGWDTGLSYRHEQKTGTRLFGRSSVRFLVDPIDYETDQVEASVGYSGERFQMVAGYYGTNFQNDIPSIAVSPVSGFSPIATPPGNQSHQVHLTGGYGFTPTTRGTFKIAYGRITQEDRFFPTVPAPLATIPENLGGKIDTSLFQAGISSRPIPRLSLRADLRHEEREDKTPVFVYTTPGATSTHDGQNEPRSFRTTVGKLDASYGLPLGFNVNGGIEQDNRKRNTSAVRAVSFRSETKETSLKLGLRRSLAETLNGAVTYVHSERDGSDWLFNTRVDGSNGSNLVHPLHLADRDRDKVRMALDWAPSDPLSVQVVAEYSQDEYGGRTLGPREGSGSFLSLDAAYRVTDNWQLTAWASRMDTRAEQTSCLGAAASPATITCPTGAGQGIWEARLRNVGDAVGLGVRGKPTGALETGVELVWSRDVGQFHQAALTGSVATPAIPEIKYETLSLRLKGAYALTKSAGVRLLYVYDRFETDDWYWQAMGTVFTYVDGTTVRQDPKQEVHFIGASFYYQFR